MDNDKLEQKLRKEFTYTKFGDNFFDRVMLSDIKFAKGKAVAIFTRMYENYSPGLDQDYSGIVLTDGDIATRLIYNKVIDSTAGFGGFHDEDNYIKKIKSFDGNTIEYEVKSGKVKKIEL